MEVREGLDIRLYLSREKKIIKINLEEYVVGAVAAEMPASFEIEALKAQAVCARTYAVRKILSGRKYEGGADLSDDVNECQAYISPENFKKKDPDRSGQFLNKIKQAVVQTEGIIIVYEGEPVDALYHSTCGGKTANADEVWQKRLPYLRSVNCKYCTSSPYYIKKYQIECSHIKRVLNIDKDIKTIKIVERDSTGRARKVKINDHIFEASLLRRKLNLPSTWWEFIRKDDKIEIKTRGYGHGVGLCQYGANGMALRGYDYKEIIKYYYHNVEFYKMNY
ncbi:stage II sporulation protein D [Thermosyntropha sp.]|uniref:stage II sporulation protein D n=1 Tax=Thermosyntropha sp. TaxID=2740820 RepID=UPI0025DC37DE|nr:stage II sporulation protein D [Thermosyntropha sp.]MBO8157987.1 stage II sporulation protein D [Thermosyntropha sp.]